jgi:deoxyribonuclease-4
MIILHPLQVGSHISKHSTLTQTFEYAIYNHLHIFQLYLCSPRGYNVPVPQLQDVIEARELLRITPNARVFIHGCLLYNLCSSKPEQLEKTIEGLRRECDIVSAIGGHGVVVHPGSCPNKQQGLQTIINSLIEVLETYTPTTERLSTTIGITTRQLCSNRRILLECCAGEGNKLCKNIEELKCILDGLPKHLQTHVGVCIDTAHLHSAGDWDLSESSNINSFFDAFDEQIGLNKLWLIHLNDSAVEFGAKKDRHAPIGNGSIFTSKETYCTLLKKCHTHRIPMVMELPVSSMPYIHMSREMYDKGIITSL